MVEVVLSEGQRACLKAAVTVGSEESSVLGRSVRIGSGLFSSAKFVVKCRREIAMRLLSVAERFCADVAPGIRAAVEHEKQ